MRDPIAELGLTREAVLALEPSQAQRLLVASARALLDVYHPDRRDRPADADRRVLALLEAKEIIEDPGAFNALLHNLKRSNVIETENAQLREIIARNIDRLGSTQEIVAQMAEAVRPGKGHTSIQSLRNTKIKFLDISRAMVRGAGWSVYQQILTAEANDEPREARSLIKKYCLSLTAVSARELYLSLDGSAIHLSDTALIGTLQCNDLEALLKKIELFEQITGYQERRHRDRGDYPENTSMHTRYQIESLLPAQIEPLWGYYSPFIEPRFDTHSYLVTCHVPEGEWENRRFSILGRTEEITHA